MSEVHHEHEVRLAGPVSAEPPSGWDLQRQLDRVDADRRSDLTRLEERHQSDRRELRVALDQLAVRLEGAIKANAGVPLATWNTYQVSIDREFGLIRDDIGQVRGDLDKLRNLYVGTILVMILGGIGTLVMQGGFVALG